MLSTRIDGKRTARVPRIKKKRAQENGGKGLNVEKNIGTERCWGGGGRMTGTEETINADPKDAWATWYWKSSFLREFSSLESAEPLDFYTANSSTSPCATHAILWTSILHDFVVTIVEREFPADIFRGARFRFTCDPLLSRAHVNDQKRSSRKSSSYGECVILYICVICVILYVIMCDATCFTVSNNEQQERKISRRKYCGTLKRVLTFCTYAGRIVLIIERARKTRSSIVPLEGTFSLLSISRELRFDKRKHV